VLKPSLLGFERCAALARWAAARGVATVVSSAFESAIGLSSLAALAALVDAAQPGAGRMSHGLGTSSWFRSDVAGRETQEGSGFDASRARRLLSGAGLLPPWSVEQPDSGLREEQQQHEVSTLDGARFSLRILRVSPASASSASPPAALLLHGFFGSSADWLPLARGLALALRRPIVALDLPGHGASRSLGGEHSLPSVSAALQALVPLLCGGERVGLVGYSAGGRVALHAALHSPQLFSSLVLVSATAGVRGAAARAARAARDDDLAFSLCSLGPEAFSEHWYRQKLFSELSARPGFQAMEARRAEGRSGPLLAASLGALSPGRAPDLWPALAGALADGAPLRATFVAGECDAKFVAAARKMAECAGGGLKAEVVELPATGHAAHLEAAERLASVLYAALC
jgi:2-succinyl-6-hydroxy-2,4-cyclohexadiene-1-carboxylate synthase